LTGLGKANCNTLTICISDYVARGARYCLPSAMHMGVRTLPSPAAPAAFPPSSSFFSSASFQRFPAANSGTDRSDRSQRHVRSRFNSLLIWLRNQLPGPALSSGMHACILTLRLSSCRSFKISNPFSDRDLVFPPSAIASSKPAIGPRLGALPPGNS